MHLMILFKIKREKLSIKYWEILIIDRGLSKIKYFVVSSQFRVTQFTRDYQLAKQGKIITGKYNYIEILNVKFCDSVTSLLIISIQFLYNFYTISQQFLYNCGSECSLSVHTPVLIIDLAAIPAGWKYQPHSSIHFIEEFPDTFKYHVFHTNFSTHLKLSVE